MPKISTTKNLAVAEIADRTACDALINHQLVKNRPIFPCS